MVNLKHEKNIFNRNTIRFLIKRTCFSIVYGNQKD